MSALIFRSLFTESQSLVGYCKSMRTNLSTARPETQ